MQLAKKARASMATAAWRTLGRYMGQLTPASAYRGVRKGYDLEDEAKQAISQVVGSTMLSYERLVTLYEQVVHLERNRIPGALVECGVWKGGAAGVMALANLRHGAARRPIHLFDSFQGMPEPEGQKDGSKAIAYVGGKAAGQLVATGVDSASRRDVESLLLDKIGYPRSELFIHEGWFQDTLPSARGEVGPIALLRADGDWYDSTKTILESLYRQVVTGGIVVIDDYGYWQGCKLATDEFLAEAAPHVMLHYIDSTGRYFVKPANAS